MKELFSALAKAQSQIRGALKDSTNPHFKSRYADLESVMDAMRQPFGDNNLGVIQTVRDFEAGAMLVTIITHASGDSIESMVPFMVGKNDSQGVGSALTYARRYGLATACGISQTDDDAEAAMGRFQPQKQPQKQQPEASFRETLTQAIAKGDAYKETNTYALYKGNDADKRWLIAELASLGMKNDKSEEYAKCAGDWHKWSLNKSYDEILKKLKEDLSGIIL